MSKFGDNQLSDLQDQALKKRKKEKTSCQNIYAA